MHFFVVFHPNDILHHLHIVYQLDYYNLIHCIFKAELCLLKLPFLVAAKLAKLYRFLHNVMGSTISVLCPLTVLIGMTNGAACVAHQTADRVFCEGIRQEEKCRDHTDNKCYWQDDDQQQQLPAQSDVLTGISIEPQRTFALLTQETVTARFNDYIKDITNEDFINSVKKEKLTLDVSSAMEYSTNIAMQVLHLWFNDYFSTDKAAEDLRKAMNTAIEVAKNKVSTDTIDWATEMGNFDHTNWYILAVGSFGRSELLPCSDLDIAIFAIDDKLLNRAGVKQLEANKDPLMHIKTLKNNAANEFIKNMKTKIETELDNTYNFQHNFVQGAWKFDEKIPTVLGDSVNNLVQNALSADDIDNHLEEIAFFGDAQVIYQKVTNDDKSFDNIQIQWIQQVPLRQLNHMLRLKLEMHFDQQTLERIRFSESHDEKDRANKGKDVVPKTHFVRAYTLLTYWSYIIAYKSEKKPWQNRGIFVRKTVERMGKLAEWGYIPQNLAEFSRKYFYLASQWNLHANLIATTEEASTFGAAITSYKWAHGKGFDYSKSEMQKKMVEQIMTSDNEEVASLKTFGKTIRINILHQSTEIAKRGSQTYFLPLPQQPLIENNLNLDLAQINALISSQSMSSQQMSSQQMSSQQNVKAGSSINRVQTQQHEIAKSGKASKQNDETSNKNGAHLNYINFMGEFSGDYQLYNQPKFSNRQKLDNQQSGDIAGLNGLETEFIIFSIIELFGLFFIICFVFICLSGFLLYHTGYTRSKNKSSHLHFDECDVDNGSNYQFL